MLTLQGVALGLREDLRVRIEAERPPKRCALGLILDSMEDAGIRADIEYSMQQIAVEATLPQNERLFTLAWLHGVLTDNGYKVGRTVVGEHVRGECICE